jgi:2-polyprenyl-6-methoxyphenol hydroxylase-like FAD-dependent oxidoreductase
MVAAIALKRRGFQPEIAEIEGSFKAVGVGVNLQNSPLRALDTLGLVDEIEKRGYPTHVVNMLTADGRAMIPPLRA